MSNAVTSFRRPGEHDATVLLAIGATFAGALLYAALSGSVA